MTRVVVADDQALVRTGVRTLLESRGLEVVGEAADGQEAVTAARRLDPDVLVLDIRMPRLDGIEATRRVRREAPRTHVLILTTYDLDEYVYEALRAGAAGFLLKSSPVDRLADAIRLVAAGDALLEPAITRRLIAAQVHRPPPDRTAPPALDELTPREREVLVLIARGLSNDEIAAALVVSLATVKTHVNRVLAKLGAASRAQAVVAAYESGLVRPRT